jgi:acyl-CoA thioesterase
MTTIGFEPSWQAFDGIFGGYVISRLLQAAELDDYLPLSISVQFMGAVRPGPAELRAQVTHRGSLTAAVDLAIIQQHRRASAVVKLGRQPAARIIDQPADVVDRPRPDQLEPPAVPYGPYQYEAGLDVRMAPGPGTAAAERMHGWIRLDPATNSLGLFAVACIYLDAPPPGPFFLDESPIFVPTVDFTAHFAPQAEWAVGDWMRISRSTLWATREFCLEEASLYTASGQLVAQARQTRRIRWALGDALNRTRPAGLRPR